MPGALAPSPVPGGPVTGSFSWDTVVARLKAGLAGEFEILVELGRGGFAAVHLAHERSLNRRVALKIMSPAVLMGDGMLERAQQEAVTHANLEHPNIVPVHGMRVVDDLFLVVMQYVPGRSLQQVIRAEGEAGRRIPLDVIRAVLFQVGSALAYAHRRGVVHRDIKPANILLSADGAAVVTDFGIAKVSESQSHTLTGTVMGTAQYMSPEQCYAATVTGASDQYSLGVVAYELLTGRPPFSGSTFAVMQAQTSATPPPPRALRPDCPADVDAAVLRMLAKVPEDRFATIPEALFAMGARQPSTLDDDPVRSALVNLAAVELVERRLGIRAAPGNVPRTPLPSAERALPAETPAPRREREPSRITLTLASTTVEVGNELKLSAVVRSRDDEVLTHVQVRWSATDPTIARIDPSRGVLTGLQLGSVFIAASAGEAMATARIDVLDPRGAGDMLLDQPGGEAPEASAGPSRADPNAMSLKEPTISTATAIGSSIRRETGSDREDAQPVEQQQAAPGVSKRPGRWNVLALLGGVAAVAIATAAILNRPPAVEPDQASQNLDSTSPNLDSVNRAALAMLSRGETLLAIKALQELVVFDSARSYPAARELLSLLDSLRIPPPSLDSMYRAALATLGRGESLSTIKALQRLVARDSARTYPNAHELLRLLVKPNSPKMLASRVTVSANARVEVGERTSATAKVLPSPRPVRWSSSDQAIASVSAAGQVVGVSVGTVRIIATADIAHGEVVITVTEALMTKVHVEGVSRLQVGATAQWSGRAETRRGTAVQVRDERWHSANLAVATVDNEGRVRAVGAGSTEISFSIGDVRDTRSLTVEVPPLPGSDPGGTDEASQPAFTDQEAAAAARRCGDALRDGVAGISAQFQDNTNRANLLKLLARGGVRLNANDRVTSQGEVARTRASVSFSAETSFRTSFGRDRTTSFSVMATTRLQDGRWTPVGCQITGSPTF